MSSKADRYYISLYINMSFYDCIKIGKLEKNRQLYFCWYIHYTLLVVHN